MAPACKSIPQKGDDKNRNLPWRDLVGPAFLVGGFGVISTFYAVGVAAIYIGFFVLIVEIVFEPWIRQKRFLRTSLVVAWLFLIGLFTFEIVFMPGPLDIYSFAMRKGNYADGTNIEGIVWNSHFTDSRVIFNNPTDDDYKDINLVIKPDRWITKAVISGTTFGCDLTPLNGRFISFAIAKETGIITPKLTTSGSQGEIHDQMGDIYSTVANDGDYRLTCTKFPAHESIKLVFAVVTINPTYPPNSSSSGKPLFDRVFGVRTSPSDFSIKGTYSRKIKSFSIDRSVDVKDGD
jgi:hypothetical protein